MNLHRANPPLGSFAEYPFLLGILVARCGRATKSENDSSELEI